MSEDGGGSRRRHNNDGKQHASFFYSATEEEEEEVDDEEVEVEVVSLSETESDWQGSSDSGGDGESSGDDMFVEEEEEKGGLDSESVSHLLHPETRSVNGANLKLVDCKAYLRKHGLRVGGTKAVCLQRINEHLRIGKLCGLIDSRTVLLLDALIRVWLRRVLVAKSSTVGSSAPCDSL